MYGKNCDRRPRTFVGQGIGQPWKKDTIRMERVFLLFFDCFGYAVEAGYGNAPVPLANVASSLPKLTPSFSTTKSNPPPPPYHNKNKATATPVSFVSGGSYEHDRLAQSSSSTTSSGRNFQVKEEGVVDAEKIEEVEGRRRTNAKIVEEPSSKGERSGEGVKPKTEVSLNEIEWIAQPGGRGQVFLQMMERMGYEHGKGLGRAGQGIVEPIRANPNPGKQALGAETPSHRRARGGRRRGGGGNRNSNVNAAGGGAELDDGEAGASDEQQQRGASYDAGAAARMRYQDNVRHALLQAGLTEQSAAEIWQAMGVLAKHKIMPLGMGVGLVKRMTGKRRLALESNEQ